MKNLGFFGVLLSSRDWIYVLGLLVPFVVYDLVLKTYEVASQPQDLGLARVLGLVWSDVSFSVGYALLWIGLFSAVRRGLPRRAVVILLHATTILVVALTTSALQYFRQSGTTLDYGTIAEWIPKLGELVPIFVYDVPLLAWVLLSAALFYATLGPWLLTRAVERWGGQRSRSLAATPGGSFRGYPARWLAPLGLWILALAFGFLSLLIGPSPASAGDRSFARAPVVNLVITGVEEATAEENYLDVGPAAENSVTGASLVETSQTEKRNVVLIHLESTRAQSVTPYNEDLKTTPFLDELAEKSLLAERAYVVVPRSSKGSVAANCGVEPPLFPGPEFEPDGVPAQCLADLLKGQGYNTVFFASTSNTMDNFDNVVRGFGYEEVYSSESMDVTGYEVTNTFGYEDDVMLGPSEEWLKNRDEGKHFLAEYFTGTGHYGYECSSLRTGFEDFGEEEELNRYLNCLRYVDSFLGKLFDQYKKLGLYEDTIFVLYGDHGQGFGEHDRYMHGDTIYEEGLKVPLIVHDPRRFQEGKRVEGLASQIDVLPTVLDLLGYETEGGEYPGYSLLDPLPEDRTLKFSCITNQKCMASIKDYKKYIYHYGDQPDEFFDLAQDPLEEDNLAGEGGARKIEMDRRREELLTWRARLNALYEERTASAETNPE